MTWQRYKVKFSTSKQIQTTFFRIHENFEVDCGYPGRYWKCLILQWCMAAIGAADKNKLTTFQGFPHSFTCSILITTKHSKREKMIEINHHKVKMYEIPFDLKLNWKEKSKEMNWFTRKCLKWLSVQCHLPIIGVSSRRSQSHIHNEKKLPHS